MKRAFFAFLVCLLCFVRGEGETQAGTQFPFSFWKPNGFNPATSLSFNWWQSPDYPGTGNPWPGTVSLGPSGTTSNNTSAAIAGSAVNGHIPLHIVGGTSSTSANTLDNYITTTAIYAAVVFNTSTLPPDNGAGSRSANAQLLCTQPSALWGVDVSTSGVGLWILSSFVAYVEINLPVTTNVWHVFQIRYDGSNVTIRLDGGTWTAPAAVVPGFNGISLSSQTIRFGTPTYAGQNPTADIAEGFLSKTAISTMDFDNYLSYLRTRYAQPF